MIYYPDHTLCDRLGYEYDKFGMNLTGINLLGYELDVRLACYTQIVTV